MFGLEPPPIFPFHPQHQGQIGHGAQQVESSQNNIRNSPPINGPNQFVNSNSNSNPNDNAKFGQAQQLPHEMGNIHVSAGIGSHGHEMQGPVQPNPQLGHQHHQHFPPYFFPSYIPSQFTIPVHAVRTPQYYGAPKGHPSPAYPPQTMIDLHGPHGGHQPPYFPPEGKQQKHNVLYGHPNDSQDSPFDKSQQQASSQSSQQQQGHLQGDMPKGQGPFPALSPGYNFNPHLHPYQGQPQN
jgi:hypothetical protein